jgi:hypothetical protein
MSRWMMIVLAGTMAVWFYAIGFWAYLAWFR